MPVLRRSRTIFHLRLVEGGLVLGKLSGRTALVTGGAKEMERVIALLFARERGETKV